MKALFEQTIHYDKVAKRNITSIAKPQHAFATLTDQHDDIQLINQLSEAARHTLSYLHNDREFFYTAAIGYPFRTQPFMQSRFSDGSYPVWYGSKTVDTTIYETVFHVLRHLRAEEGIEQEEVIIKKRTLFNVNCNAILLDLTDKPKSFPELLSANYEFTNTIGKRVKDSGMSGLLYCSSRVSNGINLSIFNESVLSKPQLLGHLQYQIFLKAKRVKVTGMKKPMTIEIE